ncbi:MAG: twin-arginine translocation signal domain-containing protein, partial [Pseudomonadota bacterium]
MAKKIPSKPETKSSQRPLSRRKFLAATAASGGGAAAIGFPMISRADTISMKWQST